MAKTQMNVRIDEDVKRVGDAVFADLGYNPTQVVSIIWQFAAANQRNQKRVKDTLNICEQGLQAEEIERRERMQAAVERHGQLLALFNEMTAASETGRGATLPELANEELHELAFEERAREKGCL